MHQSVMLDEVISSLNLKPGDKVLDATIGGGGHSIQILKRIQPGGKLIGLDADASAVKIARQKLEKFGPSCVVVHSNFRDLDKVLSQQNIETLDAALFDIGVSSFQLEDAARGFSFQQDGRLDMRLNPELLTTAYDIVNRLKEEDLSSIIREYGEERHHKRIARAITRARAGKPIETTLELRRIIHGAIGSRRGRMRIDPATRTFQAIRIAVNDELAALEEGLHKTIARLSPGARICVISFHSLEDRIVKNIFREYGRLGALTVITKKPVRPSQQEMAANPRSRSARLRVAQKNNFLYNYEIS
ncbi:MAG: 16S rRNA (cytosine(1402)-N(4))-methyltransferase RsmH [Candidatus Omnitrophica bacterium]|nr:16S rRNA (cytosine(1402)-N(4))-methyltransferase RsmH [Candidatus Omnitrophota bacterium]MCM8790708.1 16S rRNA (cytosine(1402)-N(4))-methyltransferase RsmH [Candidatus Omnitrophota bacterium]